MPCYHPLKAWRGPSGPSGRLSVVFDASKSYGIEITLPCGQCRGCRLARSRQWATRIMHEASLHESNCFLTLTYSDHHVPKDGSLKKKHFQDFMKRLRGRVGKLRFFHCGEYGERFARPHYHACIFGFGFPDRVVHSVSNGNRLYTSRLLEEVWPFGFGIIGELTFESAAYVARYVMKKITGDMAHQTYKGFDPDTGELRDDLPRREPEYVTMSRGGRNGRGIGHEWFARYGGEVFPSDEVIARGVSCKPPRYYDKLFEEENPEAFEEIRRRRLIRARASEDNSPDRLAVREVCAEARVDRLIRRLDCES